MDLVAESCGGLEPTCMASNRRDIPPISWSSRETTEDTPSSLQELDLSLGSMDINRLEHCNHSSTGLEFFQSQVQYR